MNRDYTTGTSEDVKMFVGIEVEHTQMHGETTLFVVGTDWHPNHLELRAIENECKHIYLGANMSFDVNKLDEFDNLATYLLDKGYWVTLDFDVSYVQKVLEYSMVERDRFIPMISVKIPYADQLGYNACVKIDDKDFRASNNGVWTHRLRGLMDSEKFTPWSKYTQDKVIE